MRTQYEVKQVILMRRDLRNTKGEKVRSGKLMAQAAHAAMMWLSRRVQLMWSDDGIAPCKTYFSLVEEAWLTGSFAKVVLGVDSETELQNLVAQARSAGITAEICTDNGTTEFGGVRTVTCAAIGPAESEFIDTITGHLRPL